MLRKDYIQRQLEEFGKVLAVILGAKTNRDWDAFERELHAAVKKYSGMELAEIESLSDESFAHRWLRGEGVDQETKKILARLLFEKMEHCLGLGDLQRAAALRNRCLLLYTHIQENFSQNEFDMDVHFKLAALQQLQQHPHKG